MTQKWPLVQKRNGRPYVPKVVAKVVALLDHENPAHQLRASEIVLERVYGRPLQASEVRLQDQRAEALAARQPMMPEQVKAGMAEVWARMETEAACACARLVGRRAGGQGAFGPLVSSRRRPNMRCGIDGRIPRR